MLFFILLWGASLQSQTIQKLDTKYGFKHFKLKTNPNNYLGQIKETETFLPNPFLKSYEYIKNDIRHLGIVPIEDISLMFYKNELLVITIGFGNVTENFTESEYNALVYSLEKLYGSPLNVVSSETDIGFKGGKGWQGQKVDLELIRCRFPEFPTITGYMTITEKEIYQKMIEEEF